MMLDDWQRDAFVDHDMLFGVDDVLELLGKRMADTNDLIISIFGEGGVGKTALAYELVKKYYNQSGFTRIAWISAKSVHINSKGELVTGTDAFRFWKDMVPVIAKKLYIDLQVTAFAWMSEFPQKIRNLPDTEKCLIVIDNLETLEDTQSIITYFDQHPFLGPHKVLITTRESIQKTSSQPYVGGIKRDNGVMEYNLRGLTQKDAYAFIRHLEKENHDHIVASEDELYEILSITDGNPFLIKLIVRMFIVGSQSVSAIVSDLKRKKGDLGARVGAYLYTQSLTVLEELVGEEPADDLMNVFCSKISGEVFDYEEFYRRSMIRDRDKFDQVSRTACDLALVRALDQHKLFTMHSLLREYICGS